MPSFSRGPNAATRGRAGWLLLSLLFSAGCGGDASEVSGRLTVEPSVLELSGDSRQDPRREVSCRLTNDSSRPVRVASIQTSCSCTIADPLERTSLKPGESVPLRLQVTLPVYGRKEAAVTIEADPPSASPPRLRLILHGPARPVPFVESLPQDIWLSGHLPGESVTRECEITTVEAPASEPWIRGLSTADNGIEARPEGPPEESPFGDRIRRVYRFRITGTLPQTTEGAEYFSLSLDVATPVGDAAGARIRGKRFLDAVARVVPAEIVVRQSDVREHPVKRTVLVVADDDDLITLDPPPNLPAWIAVRRAEPQAADRLHSLELMISDPPAAGLVETLRFTARSKNHGPVSADLTVNVTR